MNRAFTIFEVAIVLTVISLIIVIIISSSVLINNSKLRSIFIDISNYKSAVEKFDFKYRGLPGDLFNASEFFGDCAASQEICNGNGNKQISYSVNDDNESFSFWLHLELAGLINGDFTASGSNIIFNENIPVSQFDNIGYFVNFDEKNYLYLISKNYNYNIVTGEDAFYLDKKFDDGKAVSGLIISSCNYQNQDDAKCNVRFELGY